MFDKFYFEKLNVWQNSRRFSVKVYHLTSGFPKEEKFGLTSQIRRAAISISGNIAEGMSRNTNKDKVRFLNIAFASAIETLNFLDRKSTRLNSSHVASSYAAFCLKKKHTH